MNRVFQYVEPGDYPAFMSISHNPDGTVTVVIRGHAIGEYEAGAQTEIRLPGEVFSGLVNTLALGVIGL